MTNTMASHILEVGDRVRVISYGPFKGLRGTVRKVERNANAHDDEEPFFFYQIDLEESQVKEPVWFQDEEVESISPQEIEYLRSV